jgi:GT2 family glycosyltransferase
MKLSVIIVSYNVRHYLAQCLDSVVRATVGMEADIWVVDNQSQDGSVTYLRELFPQVHYIENEENVGFSRANNQAIRLSQGEYVLLLNPDTIVGEDVLHGCVNFLDQHPEAGATGTMMLNRNGSFAKESRRGVPTPATSFYKLCGLCSLYPHSRRFGKYNMCYLDKNASTEIEIISGAFFMLRREALEQVGLLSEEYFMYGEDIDLGYSLLKAGWKNFYQPLPILHYKGESTLKTSFRYVHSFYNAMLIFFNRHFRKRYRLLSLLIRLAVVLQGTLFMLRQQLCRPFRRKHNEQDEQRRLLFIGSDSAFTALQELCRQTPLCIERIKDYQEAVAVSRAQTYNYICFQTGDEGTPYAEVLRSLIALNEEGIDLHLGTFNLSTKTLVLPDAIIY